MTQFRRPVRAWRRPAPTAAMAVAVVAATLATASGVAADPPTTRDVPKIQSSPAGITQPGRPEVEMARYVFGMLKRGPNAPAPGTPPTDEAKQLQAAHMDHLGSMWTQGKLLGAGPILKEGDLRGILIFGGLTADEAQALAAQDPKVKAGVLQVEVHPWMAASGIGVAYNDRYAKGEDPPMVTLYLGLLRSNPAAAKIDDATLEKLQADHLANIARLGREGKLPLAGPLLDGGDLRGIFVFQAASLEEAQQLADSDPMVKSQHLLVDLLPWMVAEGVMPAQPPAPAHDAAKSAH